MLPLVRVILAVVFVIQPVNGNQRIVYISESISDCSHGKHFTSGEGDSSFICCAYNDHSCNSLDYALANLTSNVLINITTDVTLSALIKMSNLENVSIVGHNSPTVSCENG